MGKTRKPKKEATQMFRFDVAARNEYLTGMRARKLARKKEAEWNLAEQARQDKIATRAEHRADVKNQHKELQRALVRATKLGTDDPDREGPADEEGEAPEPEVVPEPVDTVAFSREEADDLFGDCEVTTTVGLASGFAPPGAAGSSEPWEPWQGPFGASGRGLMALGDGEAPKDETQDRDWEKNIKRKVANLQKQEEIRKKALKQRLNNKKPQAKKKKKGKDEKKSAGGGRKKGKKGKGKKGKK